MSNEINMSDNKYEQQEARLTRVSARQSERLRGNGGTMRGQSIKNER